MVAFVSLFLGLIFGVRDVTLAVGDNVARVEVRLDGQVAGELHRPPWTTPVDLGPEPAPHDLVAVAFDSNGKELSRVRQRINRPRLRAEASLILEGGANGHGRIGRLAWQSLTEEMPSALNITFDGEPLLVADPRRFELPAHVPERLHFLRAELEFSGNVSAVAELTFGGRYSDEAQSELTAVPVALDKGKKLPPVESLSGWFAEDGEPLQVVAAEEGPAEVVVVMDGGARDRVEGLAGWIWGGPMQQSLGISKHDLLRSAMTLRKDQRLRFVATVPEQHQHSGTRYDLFPRSEDFTRKDGGLLWLATRLRRFLDVPPNQQRLADAVAVAGLSAAGRDRRRAVVLVLGPSPEDDSEFTVNAVRHYLERLMVPVHVWCSGPLDAGYAWGGCADVSTFRKLEDEVSDLAKGLERQRIVWVAGTHLPHRIGLSDRAAGVALAR